MSSSSSSSSSPHPLASPLVLRRGVDVPSLRGPSQSCRLTAGTCRRWLSSSSSSRRSKRHVDRHNNSPQNSPHHHKTKKQPNKKRAAPKARNHPSTPVEGRVRRRRAHEAVDLSKIIASTAPIVESRPQEQTTTTKTHVPANHTTMDPETQTLRGTVAQIIPYIVSRDPVWRETVLNILRASFTSSASSPSKQQQQGNTRAPWLLDKNAQQWYQTSLSSFRERLDAGDYPAPIAKALDFLGRDEVGFASIDFQRNFRALPNHRHAVSKITAETLQQEQNVENLRKKLDKHAKELAILQHQLDLRNYVPQQQQAGDASFWQGAWNSISNFFSQRQNDKTQQEDSSSPRLDKKTKQLLRKLDKQKNQVKSIEDSLLDARKKLERLRQQRQSLTSPMSNETFDKATAAAEQVREDFCSYLANHIAERHQIVLQRYQVLDEKTDLTRPQEWFPYARLDQRKIIFHSGPTNSGKTFEALERLKQAKRGMYLGPLRLLAAEIYENLTTQGIYCNLYTGQERREIPFATHGAATVEMASAVDDFDVVCIDEIQMLADPERGFAWTRALLGSRCKEIHVCGGSEAEPILRKLASACGDELQIKKYQRFSALSVAKKSIAQSSNQLEAYKNVEKGDCVVAFSRNDIFAIKREIERLTKFKCCVVYGSLPPQTRSEQARLFNDPDSGYDILVASDAIGMGLNLNIRR